MRYLFSGVFLFLFYFAQSDHIVGGELQLVHKSNGKYSITLNFYFNDLTGSPLAKDPQEYVSIFRKSDDQLMQTVYLPLISDNPIPTLGDGQCSNANVKTNLIRYTSDVELNDAQYNDPGGYYLSWERCCRNSTIDNLDAPDDAGITIYLEFPAVSSNNNVFINSSPIFQDLQNIFGCKGSPFYFDFGAADADGDSLVYSLQTPLNGHSTSANTAPVGNPAPYDSVVWKSGYDLLHAIHGDPSLKIDPATGLLLVNSSESGLFAFAVICKEYRDGKQIGLVTRDFQFFIDDCPPLFTPSLKLIKEDITVYNEGDTLEIDLNQQYCYRLSITDSTWDSLKVEEAIHFNASGLLKPTVSVFIDSIDQKINAAHPAGENRICIFAECINGKSDNYAGIYYYKIIAEDKSCPVPLLDTLDITFYIKPDTNHLPEIFPASQSATVLMGNPFSVMVYAKDEDSMDQLTLTASGIVEEMHFANVSGKDSIGSFFSFDPSCENLKNGDYQTYFIVRDDHCLDPSSDTIVFNFSIEENSVPFVFQAPNLFTPNGDSHNPFFEIPDLPADYCDNYFQKIEIYNRWGTRVFESVNRDFKWDAAKETGGIYFYVVQYSSKEYKSWVQVVK